MIDPKIAPTGFFAMRIAVLIAGCRSLTSREVPSSAAAAAFVFTASPRAFQSVEPDTRVDHPIKQIDRQIDQYEQRRHDQYGALHDGIVAMGYGVEQQASLPRQREYLLDD